MRWWPLIGVAVLAAGLRWFRIDAQSLWYDEGISAHQLTRSLADIVSASAQDTHPPLYYLTLKIWAELFGSSEFALRSLSAACGTVAVALTWLIGQRLFGSVAATLAAVLVAVSPLAVYYSQEVRMYAEVTALGLVSAYAYVTRRYWPYVPAAIATLYTQYLGAAILVALNLHALTAWRSLSRRERITWLVANGLVALAFAPWVPTLIEQQTRSLNTSPRTPQGLLVDTLSAYGGGLARGDLFVVGGLVLVFFAAAAAVLGRHWHALSLGLLLWIVPLALVLALAFRSGLFELRYLVLGIPGLALVSAFGATRFGRHPALAAVLVGAAMVPSAVGLQEQYFNATLARDDYRGLVAHIERDARANDAVVLSAPNQVEIFSYYYRGDLPVVALPAQRPIDADDTRRRLDQLKNRYDRVWLVSWAMAEADPRGVIAQWLSENGFQALHRWYGSVQLGLVGFGGSNTSAQVIDAPLENGIVLEGYRLASRELKPGETLALTLVWRADSGPTPERWKVFTHLLDGASLVVAQRDAEPSDNLRPTTSWRRGERIEDNYGILVPADLPAGSYTLEIGMYSGERRTRFNGHGDHLVLGEVQVQP